MFQNGLSIGGGAGALTLPLDRALLAPPRVFGRADRAPTGVRVPRFDVPDLGVDIGSARWWRGLAACLALCGATLALGPGLRPLPSPGAAPLAPAAVEERRAQAIGPLAWGGDTGRRMGATDAVQPLTDTPERPQIDLNAALGTGDTLSAALRRAGVAGGDAQRVMALMAGVADPETVEPGTALAITLGRRARRSDARPLERLTLRARFDLRLSFARVDGALTMTPLPIAVDRTPLRVEGRVGQGLYLAARAAGAPPSAIQTFIRALAPKVPMDALQPDDRFAMIVAQERAATGETRFGKLLYVGLERGSRATRMIEWTVDGQPGWFDAAGVGARRAGFVMPVANGRKTSGFGWRLHPLLGYSRMHQGVDYGAPHGTPIRAVTDGVVQFAGWAGGHGKKVRLGHAGGLGTGYSHMSRIEVAPGERVRQGQVIGYVGSTGLSTGPHLHFEVYRGGAVVNPATVSFESTPLLQGAELAAFRARFRAITGQAPTG